MDVFALCNLTSYFYPGGRAWFVTPLCDILVEILGDLCFLLKAFAAHSLLTVLFTSQSTEILQFNSELLVNIKFASVSTVEGVHLSSELILPCKMGFWCVSDTEVNTTCDVCNITSLCVWKHVHACTWKVFTQFDIWSIWRLSSNFWFKKIKIQVLSRCCFNFPLDQTKIHWIFICQSYADNGLSGSEINIKTVLSVTFISTGVKWLILETTVCGTSASVIFCILFNGNKKGLLVSLRSMTVIFERALSAPQTAADLVFVVRCVLVFGGRAEMHWSATFTPPCCPQGQNNRRSWLGRILSH